ncbi:MAG: NAD(P)H-dependent glycerol-3-phosphate dehydrogenase [bacterium]
MAKISIIGSGSWGTALALVLLQNGHHVILYGRDAQQIETMHASGYNEKYLPGVSLPDNVALTNEIAEAANFGEIHVLAVPSHAFRRKLQEITTASEKRTYHIVSVAKGIENHSLKRMEEVTGEVLADRKFDFTCLSGPSHAEEVAVKIPSTVVAASANPQAVHDVQKLFMTPAFRVYSHADVIGVELGGALKNVIALAAGLCDGVGFGDNTKAALMTRGLAEITRLGVAMGANALTFAGLSGMGDLIATCMSRHSRNRYVGEQIGKGKTLDEVLAGMHMVAEGVRTTKAAYTLAIQNKIEMPITEKVYAALFENTSPRTAVAELMTREAKAEKWGY